jgi:F-type H+-transporting ATPase subunit epsilon
MATIRVDIVSAEGEIHSGEALMVFAPAKMGEIGIAPRHAPLLTALKPGEVRVQDPEGKEHFFYVTGGMLEVQPTMVTVLADTALRGSQLDAAAALAARHAAEEALKGASGQTDIARATRELEEARARYQAARKLKGKRKR